MNKIVLDIENKGLETIISNPEASVTDVVFIYKDSILEDVFAEHGEKSIEILEKEVFKKW